jgi:orotate phosphoribosyltransferase
MTSVEGKIRTYDSATRWVFDLAAAGLLESHPGAGSTPYAVDTRNSVSMEFRAIAFEAIDVWIDDVRPDVVAAVASSGTLLVALWAGARNQPFINVLVKGARSRGFKRQIEPGTPIDGRRVAILDNHVRSGESLQKAHELLLRAGATVCATAAFTAHPEFAPADEFHVFLPHHMLLEAHGRLNRGG